ncbi:hypothetical protein PHJA_001048800 [Phtheirospermum japonicum]|uniref:UspA domain-containing protein n=1 Tax=Phtheirospermum japonicum TaxID=374723 RepID=A0A830C434_9LAMI|nr:hypothetical protein PHJA_001048800 [Phtheirospermum japonicum]
MTVERLNLGMKKVIVGIRLDDYAKELLDWAVVKVADSGDSVVAIHVCRDSDKEKLLLDGYLDDYEGLCNKKQIDLSAKVLKGNSIRKVLVREAKNHNASAVIVGIAKHSGLRGWTSIAKYCAKRLPPTTDIMAINNGKIIFCRCSKIPLEGPCLDPKPSFYINNNDNRSDFGESEISEASRFSFDGIESNITDDVKISPARRNKKGSLSSISLPAEDFTKQRPGWPLLQTASALTQEAVEARNMSVVQWLCDFGLAIWGPTTASFVMDSDVVGTFGYLAPEYFIMAKAAASCLTQSSRLRPKMCQILNLLNGEHYVDGVKPKCVKYGDDEEENEDHCNDDEVYPDLSAESHLSLAFLDVNDNSTSSSSFSSSSLDQSISSPLSVEEYLKKRRSPSII